jgi:hypothetical protein
LPWASHTVVIRPAAGWGIAQIGHWVFTGRQLVGAGDRVGRAIAHGGHVVRTAGQDVFRVGHFVSAAGRTVVGTITHFGHWVERGGHCVATIGHCVAIRACIVYGLCTGHIVIRMGHCVATGGHWVLDLGHAVGLIGAEVGSTCTHETGHLLATLGHSVRFAGACVTILRTHWGHRVACRGQRVSSFGHSVSFATRVTPSSTQPAACVHNDTTAGQDVLRVGHLVLTTGATVEGIETHIGHFVVAFGHFVFCSGQRVAAGGHCVDFTGQAVIRNGGHFVH